MCESSEIPIFFEDNLYSMFVMNKCYKGLTLHTRCETCLEASVASSQSGEPRGRRGDEDTMPVRILQIVQHKTWFAGILIPSYPNKGLFTNKVVI